jgi:thioredoxin 1
MIKEVTDGNFNEEVIKADQVVAVDFWASWCGPCKMLAPVMAELSEELVGKVNFAKVNVDENPVLSQKYKIASIPTVLIFKNGEAVDTMVGFRPKQDIKNTIIKNL